MKNIAIFVSGKGTNAENIIRYFKESNEISVSAIYTNNNRSDIIQYAENEGVDVVLFSREEFYNRFDIKNSLIDRKIDLIVLAGFLWLVPNEIIDDFSVINIHPSLLPKFGGKGMYGMNVHNAVIRSCEKESGITIHKVNKEYDKGDVLFQAKCTIEGDDTAESLAEKIHQLEYTFFPKIIKQELSK